MWRRALCLCLALTCLPVAALAAPLETDIGVASDAASLLLIEAETGAVIYEKDADTPRPVASITKLMTILLAIEALEQGKAQLESVVTASAEAAGMGGSQALIDANGQYTYGDLLKCVIVASANDAAVALGETLAGSEASFVEQMNRRATELGLRDTVYKNCTGLPAEGQHTTARDIAALSRLVLQKPQYFKFSGIWMDELKHQSGRITQLVNTNRLIRFYEGADGVKTGSTNEAGFCISASAKRGDTRFIAVVLGEKTGKRRFAVAQSLLSYAFDHYAFTVLKAAGSVMTEPLPVQGAKEETLTLELSAPARVLCRRGEEGRYSIEALLPETITAPVEKGEALGEARVLLDGDVLQIIPLVASAAVAEKGFMVNLRKILTLWPFTT